MRGHGRGRHVGHNEVIIEKEIIVEKPTGTTVTYTTPIVVTDQHGHGRGRHVHGHKEVIIEKEIIIEKPIVTYPTTSMSTTPIISTTQTYPTQTYPTQTYPTQTYPTQTYPTQTTTTFDPSKHPYFRGIVGPYSKPFNDDLVLSKYNNDHKIAVIAIAHNENGCTGVSAQYYVNSQNLTVNGGLHHGTAHAFGGKDEAILLDKDEYIVELFGKQGKWIDSLGFKTNKGRVAEYGAQTGVFFDVKAPPGYHFAGLSGGIGEFLDYITFELAPLPVTQYAPTFTQPTMGTMGLQGTGGISQNPF